MKFRHVRPVGWPRTVIDAVPSDLLLVVALSAAANVGIFVLDAPAVRLLAALPLLFFFPGYAVVTSLYPAAEPPLLDDRDGSGVGERLALSFGVSLALVPLVGLALWLAGHFTPVGIAATFSGVVLVGAVVGTLRRLSLAESRRFQVPWGRWRRALDAAFGRSVLPLDRVLNVLLAASVVLAVGTVGYAFVAPQEGEAYTNASLLTENAEGELVAGGYPTEIEAGTQQELSVAIENHEGTATTYTVVVRLEQLESTTDGLSMVEAQELERSSVTVGDGETETITPEIQPTMTGEQLRLSYYVYRGDAPEDPGPATADEHLYLWVSVVDSASGGDE